MYQRSPIVLLAFVFLVGCEAVLEDTDTEHAIGASTLTHEPVPAKELMITDLSVVEAGRYTAYQSGKWNTDQEGLWSFGRLIESLMPIEKPSARQRTRFTLAWLKSWEVAQTVNGWTVPPRPLMRDLVIAPWRADSGCPADPAPLGVQSPGDTCVLDFTKAPFRLLAIAHRPDLRITPKPGVAGNAGQGRFVFGVLGKNADGTERKLAFTVIFEYMLPISGWSDIISWGEKWHKLGLLPFGSSYTDALANVTRDFTKWKLVKDRPNRSAILQIRTNEVSLSPKLPKTWEMREFVLSSSGDRLVHATLKQEPDASLNGTPELGDFVSRNQSAIVNGGYVIPAIHNGLPFLAGSSEVDPLVWQVPGADEPTRAAFAIGTCSGCHLSETGGLTGTNFLHVKTRLPGQQAALSPFLEAELAGPRVADFMGLLRAKDEGSLRDGKGKDK